MYIVTYMLTFAKERKCFRFNQGLIFLILQGQNLTIQYASGPDLEEYYELNVNKMMDQIGGYFTSMRQLYLYLSTFPYKIISATQHGINLVLQIAYNKKVMHFAFNKKEISECELLRNKLIECQAEMTWEKEKHAEYLLKMNKQIKEAKQKAGIAKQKYQQSQALNQQLLSLLQQKKHQKVEWQLIKFSKQKQLINIKERHGQYITLDD